mgnify:CR=1 FL=1
MKWLIPFTVGILYLIPVGASTKGQMQPVLGEAPHTFGGGHLVESASVIKPFKWHTRACARWMVPAGAARRANQFRLDMGVAIGLPGRLELGLGLPLGITTGNPEGLGLSGGGLGDLRTSLHFGAKEAIKGGLKFLVGASLYVPTGNNSRLLGEGEHSFEGFVAMSLNAFGARLCLNLGYLLRPEHRVFWQGDSLEQDDDVTWGLGLRVPKDEDIAWSIEVAGSIGVATQEGPWPGRRSRPVWIGGGLDYPLSDRHRLGISSAILAGGMGPGFMAAVRVTSIGLSRDRDLDGVRGKKDRCPLLAEDRDGFEDTDGCPDLDNDKDGIPDSEDACPLVKAGDFSDDGC